MTSDESDEPLRRPLLMRPYATEETLQEATAREMRANSDQNLTEVDRCDWCRDLGHRWLCQNGVGPLLAEEGNDSQGENSVPASAEGQARGCTGWYGVHEMSEYGYLRQSDKKGKQ